MKMCKKKTVKKIFRRALSVMLSLLSVVAVSEIVNAEVVDLERRGEIFVTIQDSEGPVEGGNLCLYKVADVRVDENSQFYYTYTEEFAAEDRENIKIEADNISDGSLAAELGRWALEEKVDGKLLEIDEQGYAVWEDLEVGLYLIVQKDAPEGYSAITPFLVTLPIHEGNQLQYKVDAYPKLSTIAKEETPSSNPPTNPPSKPDKPSRLPQTGQLWWPVSVLALLGIVCIFLGWRIRINNQES